MRQTRRRFVFQVLGGSLGIGALTGAKWSVAAESLPTGDVALTDIRLGEGVLEYLDRTQGGFNPEKYRQILGAANEFKEGDVTIGVAAADHASRRFARSLLSATSIGAIDAHPILNDGLHQYLAANRPPLTDDDRKMTLGELKALLLTEPEPAVKSLCARLPSDVIGCVVKLMSNDELVAVGAKVFHALPGSQIGARGYLGARIQPNSPTDNVDDIRWQVFDGWSYAVGDVLLGTNPVSSDPESVAAVESTLRDVLATFGVVDVLPHCVLAHIDVQAEVEQRHPGSTALWFQSIAGNDAANKTFDISVEKMVEHARSRTGKYGLYFETGQGADFTNGHSHGCDMVLLESRKYGFARALTQEVAFAQRSAGRAESPWVHVNDVAGFIGPEVFRTREQLVRCCLEDIVMGKLHGLTIGLDVCSTLHMDVSLDDLDWCLDQILPACPAYLMGLPTKIDPMLGYLTTGYQDHVRLREKFGCRVNDAMWSFFRELAVIDAEGRPTEHFGDPVWIALQYSRRKGDPRTDEEIVQDCRRQLADVRSRGVFIAERSGRQPWDLKPELATDIQRIYRDGKQCLWAELTPTFLGTLPPHLLIRTRSAGRKDYILHPETGERLSEASLENLRQLRMRQGGRYDVQVLVSDGLNALSIMDEGHIDPFLKTLFGQLRAAGYRVAPDPIVVISGRVRAGYQIGEVLFGGLSGQRAILHLIGERPGTGHHTFSVYMTAPVGEVWGATRGVDHDLTRVISGIAQTAFHPVRAAVETVRVLKQMVPPKA